MCPIVSIVVFLFETEVVGNSPVPIAIGSSGKPEEREQVR
jgi:hypothetical protein